MDKGDRRAFAFYMKINRLFREMSFKGEMFMRKGRETAGNLKVITNPLYP